MQAYIATFFTHYDATVFHKLLSSLNISSKMMPVPRKLSSSCGPVSAIRQMLDIWNSWIWKLLKDW